MLKMQLLKYLKIVIPLIFIGVFFHAELKANGFKTPAEKVIFKTNKTLYLVGDTIYYSAFVINYQTYQLSQNSEILYIDLWSGNDKIAEQKIEISNGKGYGALVIPTSLATGQVRLIGYTSWMQNFPEISHSQFSVNVHNPKDSSRLKENDDFNFFPEGEHLLAGHLNTVVVQTNMREYFSNTVQFLNASKDTVAIFNIDSTGFGQFRLLPEEKAQYHILLNQDSLVIDFPQIESNAASLKVIKGQKEVLVFANLGIEFEADSIELLVQSKGLIVSQQKIKYESFRKIKFAFNYSILSKGLYEFVLRDESDLILSKRLLYIQGKKENQLVAIKGIQNEEKANSIVDFSLECKQGFNTGTLQIKRSDDYQSSDVYDLAFERDIFSEVGTSILSKNVMQSLQDSLWLDMFLKTQSLTTFSYEQHNDSNEEQQYFESEKSDQFILNGKIFNLETKRSLKETEIICTVSGEKKLVYRFKTDENGRFYVPIESFSGNSKIIFKLANESDQASINKIDVLLYIPKITKPKPHSVLDINRGPQYEDYIESQSKKRKISKMYCDEQSVEEPNTNFQYGLSYFSNYTSELDYTKYIILDDFREILKELVQAVKVLQTSDTTSKLRLFAYTNDEGFLEKIIEGDPLILLDGVPIYNHNIVFELSPKEVRSIRTINNKLLINGSIYSGLIEIETSDKEIFSKELDDVAIVEFQGFTKSLPQVYYSKCAAVQLRNENFPDFRDELLWYPDLNLSDEVSKKLSFKTPHDAYDYQITLEMINEKGEVISQKKKFSVKAD